MTKQLFTALLLLLGLAISPGCVASFADVSPPGPAQPAPEGAQQPSRWPMNATSAEGANVTIFQPQLEDFQGDTITARAAVAVTPAGQQQPIFGAIWLQSRVETDRSARTVQILDVQVTKILFPNTQPISVQSLSDSARQAMLAQPITLSLDHLLASLEAIQKSQTTADNLQTAPPAIIFRDHPAIKIQYDGTPRLVQSDNSNILRAINTPFFVALDPSSHQYFLKGAGHWFSAPDPMGPFQYATQIPASVSQLADQAGYSDPQQPIPDDEVSRLEIVTATVPTELIWTDGQPQMSTLPGTSLLYWANTDSDVFVDISTQQTFVLLSGRWFSAANTNGPWTYVSPDQLPPDFARIPSDSPKASVLAQVSGTQAAQDALADTYIPQTAAVDSTNYEQPPVSYDGDPDFEPIEGTTCTYAVNTDCPVIFVSGFYYCCYNAVWYQCPTARGHWVISYRIPGEIYTLPPSCPIYPVRFCHIYGYTGQVVYCGYTPGYVGCYPFHGVVVYGTGYNYKPWYHQRYVPRPSTFGFAARYHPYSGRWGFGFGVASGGGQTWIAAPQKAPERSAWFGYGGYRPTQAPATLKIKRTIVENNNVTRANYDVNVYQRRTDLHREARGVTPITPAKPNQPHEPQKPVPLAPPVSDDLKNNNVYVNKQGDVYRNTPTGWQKREGQQWKPQPNSPQPNSPQPNSPQPPAKSNEPSKDQHGKTSPEKSPPPPPPPPPSNENQTAPKQPAHQAPAQPAPQPPPPPANEDKHKKANKPDDQKNNLPKAQPPAKSGNSDQGSGAPDNDAKARERGNSRGQKNNPPPPPPPPPQNKPQPQPKPAPPQPPAQNKPQGQPKR